MAGSAPTPEVGRSPGTAPTFATRAGRGVATSCHTSVGVCRRQSPSVTSSMRQWRLQDPFLTPPDNLMTVHHHKCQRMCVEPCSSCGQWGPHVPDAPAGPVGCQRLLIQARRCPNSESVGL